MISPGSGENNKYLSCHHLEIVVFFQVQIFKSFVIGLFRGKVLMGGGSLIFPKVPQSSPNQILGFLDVSDSRLKPNEVTRFQRGYEVPTRLRGSNEVTRFPPTVE